MKKVSIKDIAKHLNVSFSIVSLTLNGRGGEKRISQDTQTKIIAYAEQQNYSPNPFAKGLKKGSSDTIGLVVPNISDTFYARIARRIEKKAEEYGYNVVFSSTEESKKKEKELIRSMLDRQVNGLIIASSQINDWSITKLKEMNFPFVLIDRYYPNIETDYVICDNKGGIESAVNYLLKRNIRRIGFVTLEPKLEAIKDRLLGYKETLEANGIKYDSTLVHELDRENFMDEMKDVFEHYQNLKVPLEAIIFSTHYLAVAGLRELKVRNLTVPGDYKIISYDEHITFDIVEPPVTVVTQPVTKMGDHAVEILLNKLKSKDKSIRQIVLDTGFIPRILRRVITLLLISQSGLAGK